jgi:crossover junction endodeoxyribonuclease RusA
MMHIDLPWPSRDLHPNARVHWAQKAKAAKKARLDAAIASLAAGIRKMGVSSLSVIATFAPPDSRRRDADGMLSSLKPSFDGIADVIGVDDSKWDIAIRRAEPVKGGNVGIEIEVRR